MTFMLPELVSIRNRRATQGTHEPECFSDVIVVDESSCQLFLAEAWLQQFRRGFVCTINGSGPTVMLQDVACLIADR